LLIIDYYRGAPQYLADRALAVDCGEYALLCRIYRQGEVGIGVSPID
jgi:elongation factor P--beta-lysine ligase